MDKKKTSGVMAVLRLAYPNNFYHGHTKDELDAATNLWAEMLADCDADAAMAAAYTFIKNDRSGFPPSIGQLRGVVEDNVKSERFAKMFDAVIQKRLAKLDKYAELAEPEE